MKTPYEIARETVNRISAFDARMLTGRDAELIAETAIETYIRQSPVQEQIVQQAAIAVINERQIEVEEDVKDNDPVDILAWELGEGVGYETALRGIVEHAIRIDRAQRDPGYGIAYTWELADHMEEIKKYLRGNTLPDVTKAAFLADLDDIKGMVG